jgi:hypothetical protein
MSESQGNSVAAAGMVSSRCSCNQEVDVALTMGPLALLLPSLNGSQPWFCKSGVSKDSSLAKSDSPLIFIKKFFLEEVPPTYLHIPYDCLYTSMAEMNYCKRNSAATQTKIIYYLVFDRSLSCLQQMKFNTPVSG